MAVLDAKLPAWQATTKALTPTKAEAKALEGKVPLVIDGGGLASGTRVLLKDQAKAEQNGLFEVTANEAFAGGGTFAGSGKFATGGGWTLTRTADADSSGEVTEGMLVPVEDGDTNEDTSWIQRTPGPIEVGATAQSFEALVAGARGVAGGDLEGSYSKPSIAEAVIDDTNVGASAGIAASKLDLAGGVAASDLAATAKELFPQLASVGSHKLATGSAAVEWAGGTKISKVTTVTHGLGAVPTQVVGAVQGLLNAVITFTVGEKNSTTFKLEAADWFESPGLGAKVIIDWIAIG